MDGPLAGVRVVDLTAVGMGPMATQVLGDQGADVVKVEPPEGDVFRHVTPQRHEAMSHAFLNLNRNKRSVVLDLHAPAGRDALSRLVARADVFVTNMRPQALRRLGLDPDTLTAAHPRLVYCGCHGYGEQGPYAGRAGVDDTIQAVGGLAALQGHGRDAPAYVNTVVADKVVGLMVAQAVAAALYARTRTGRGQAIEVPMFECLVAFVAPEHLAGLSFVPPEGGAGYARLLNPHRRPYRTADGWIAVVPYTDAQWRRFFELAGCPQHADDPRFATLRSRSRHFPELYALLESLLAHRTSDDWVALLAQADLPFAPVKDLAALIDDPHLRAVDFWYTYDHPTEGRLRGARPPVRFSDTPASIRRAPPRLGEHTDEVLRELGLDGRTDAGPPAGDTP